MDTQKPTAVNIAEHVVKELVAVLDEYNELNGSDISVCQVVIEMLEQTVWSETCDCGHINYLEYQNRLTEMMEKHAVKLADPLLAELEDGK